MLPSLFKKLLLVREIKYRNGRFYLIGETPGYMLPSYSVLLFFKEFFIRIKNIEYSSENELAKKLFEDPIIYKALKGLFIGGFIQGKLGFLHIEKRAKPLVKDKIRLIKEVLPEFASIMGLGILNLEKLELGRYYVITASPSSFAEDVFKMYGKLPVPIDFYLSGIFSGLATELHKEEFVSIELSCKAKGDKECRFHVINTKILLEDLETISKKMGQSSYVVKIYLDNIRKWQKEAQHDFEILSKKFG